MHRFDYALVGGGLQSGLIALALRARQPGAKVLLVERGASLGGNHTWCFHSSDVDDTNRVWLDPLIEYRWPGYQVRFPDRDQSVDERYLGLSSRRLHEVVSEMIEASEGSQLALDTDINRVDAHSIEATDGRVFEAAAVIDARGPEPAHGDASAGFQKFVGQEVTLEKPHGLDRPVLMDARIAQEDGYRFMYLLPFGPQTLLVEDTRFSDSSMLNAGPYRERISDYVGAQGWSITEVVREEFGVLPMPWTADFEEQSSGPFRAGYRGGWFHPGTGYSFPVAVRVADFVSAHGPDELFGPDYRLLARAHRRQLRYAHLLNRLLFRWYPPQERTSIFERFYRLPADTRRAFYGLQLSPRDMSRLLGGRPPRGLSIRHRLGL